MIRIASIADGQIRNVSLAPEGWQAPGDGSQMLEADAVAAGLTYWQPPVERLPVESWRLRAWLCRREINPQVAVPAAIEAAFPEDGPLRWEALARWESAQWIPFDNPFVGPIATALGLNAGQVWDEILSTS